MYETGQEAVARLHYCVVFAVCQGRQSQLRLLSSTTTDDPRARLVDAAAWCAISLMGFVQPLDILKKELQAYLSEDLPDHMLDAYCQLFEAPVDGVESTAARLSRLNLAARGALTSDLLWTRHSLSQTRRDSDCAPLDRLLTLNVLLAELGAESISVVNLFVKTSLIRWIAEADGLVEDHFLHEVRRLCSQL